jgi:hypothetical protein
MISVATEVATVVDEFVQEGEMFSAFDVTRALRNRLPGENIRHASVKTEVHSIFTNGDMTIYQREQVDVGTRVNPFIYHLPHEDPEDYNPRWLDAQLGNTVPVSVAPMAIINPASIPDPTPSTTTASDPHDRTALIDSLNSGYKTVKTSSDGRLNLPVKMLQPFSGTVYVSLAVVRKNGQNVDALTVSNQNTAPNSLIRTYQVNADGRLRLSPRYLNKAGQSDKYAVKYIQPTNGHETIVVVPED